jgi:hypothetical protein
MHLVNFFLILRLRSWYTIAVGRANIIELSKNLIVKILNYPTTVASKLQKGIPALVTIWIAIVTILMLATGM